MRRPVYRRRDSHSGSLTELENLSGNVKGKSTSGRTARLKVPMCWAGADCFVVVMKQGNACEAKGAGHRHWDRINRQREESDNQWRAAALVRWHEPYESRGSRTDL